MKDTHINGYSLALLDIAKEEKKLEKFKEQSTVIVDVLNDNSTYIEILGSYNIDTNEKLELVKKAFSGKIEKSLENYISLLVEKKKVWCLIPSLKKLIALINELKGIHEGIVYSVSKLTTKQIKNIEETTSKKLGYEVKLENKLDVELISGIKVVVGDQVIDNSIATKMQNLKQKLLEGQVQ